MTASTQSEFFDIALEPDRPVPLDLDYPAAWARITINDWTEGMLLPTAYFTAHDYEHQWCEAARAILRASVVDVAFVHDLRAPIEEVWAMFLWRASRHETVITFEDLYLPLHECDPRPKDLDSYLATIRADSEDSGSVWVTSLAAIEAFVMRRCHQC